MTDAGTPLISDPGYRLVRAAIEAGIGVTSVPGASAVTTALAASGLPPHPFRFIGFLPRAAAARRAALKAVASDPATLVAFEAPRRLTDALRDALATLGDRPACLARNLTKPHERYQRGTLSQIVAELEAEGEVRGESTIVIGGATEAPAPGAEAEADARLLLDGGAPARAVQALLVERRGLSRRAAYDLAAPPATRMTEPIVDRVLRSARYRDVDRALLDRLAAEELPKARNADDAVKRVKRRLHQAVGAYRGARATDALAAVRAAWDGDLADPRVPRGLRRGAADARLDRRAAAASRALLRADLGADRRPAPDRCSTSAAGSGRWPCPGWGCRAPRRTTPRTSTVARSRWPASSSSWSASRTRSMPATSSPTARPRSAPTLPLLLKLVPLLDRQDPSAAARVLRALDARYAVITFPSRSLGGGRRGMAATYRRRLDDLVAETGVSDVREASVPNELVFVLTLDG